jgi:AcrR family transcriptional regulator
LEEAGSFKAHVPPSAVLVLLELPFLIPKRRKYARSDGSARASRSHAKGCVGGEDVLLDAAAIEFAKHDLDASVDAITDRAGVGRARLYRNFADGDELFLAVFTDLLSELHERIRHTAGVDAFIEFVNDLADLVLYNITPSAALRQAQSRDPFVILRLEIIAAGTAALSLSQAAGRYGLISESPIFESFLDAGLETAEPSEGGAISLCSRSLVLDGLRPRP